MDPPLADVPQVLRLEQLESDLSAAKAVPDDDVCTAAGLARGSIFSRDGR